MKNVAVFGLGSMGLGMAQSLLRAGHVVHGVDIDEARMAAFREEGGADGAVSDVAASLDAVVTVVLNGPQTEAVLFGENGIAATLKPGTVVMSCATITPALAQDLEARCADHGLLYLDAPISGGSLKAASGDLSIMASGSEAAFGAAKEVLDATAATVFTLGAKAGAGSAMKAVNQLLVGVHIAAMGEAVAFAKTQGVDPETVLEVISQCAGTSWALENRLPHIVDDDYAPRSAVNIWLKDLGIVDEICSGTDLTPHLARTALAQFQKAADAGRGREDDAVVVKVYAGEAGIDL